MTPEERDILLSVRSRVHHRLVEELNVASRAVGRDLDRAYLAERARDLLASVTAEEKGLLLPQRLRNLLVSEVVDEVVGFGPLQPLLDDPSTTEILVNGPRKVLVERDGRFELTDVAFDDTAHIVRIVQKILALLGRRLDERSPMVDARLPDGARLNAVIPPVALNSPLVTIRKHAERALTAEGIVELGTLTEQMWQFLSVCVKARLNIVVSGGPGSGKTTLLRLLAETIPEGERIITVEDSAELMLKHDNLAAMETRPGTVEGVAEIGIGDLVRNALRMRPDRIIVGEVRGKEALDMLQALNTGTEGSLSTLHSNSPRDTLSRLESMCMMAGLDLPPRAIARQIESALHLIVHLSRFSDGARRITHISEVFSQEADVPGLQDVFVFRQTGVGSDGRVIGCHERVGIVPRCRGRLEAAGFGTEALLADTQKES